MAKKCVKQLHRTVLECVVCFFFVIHMTNILTLFHLAAVRGSQYVELPYTVKGMDVSFSGILSYIEVSGSISLEHVLKSVI